MRVLLFTWKAKRHPLTRSTAFQGVFTPTPTSLSFLIQYPGFPLSHEWILRWRLERGIQQVYMKELDLAIPRGEGR